MVHKSKRCNDVLCNWDVKIKVTSMIKSISACTEHWVIINKWLPNYPRVQMDCFNSFMLSFAKILSYLRHRMIFGTSSQKKSDSYFEWTKLFSSWSPETCNQNLKRKKNVHSIFKIMSLLSTIIMTTCQLCSFSRDLDIWKSLQKVSS